jgi:tryptophan 2,3-dioxygenase
MARRWNLFCLEEEITDTDRSHRRWRFAPSTFLHRILHAAGGNPPRSTGAVLEYPTMNVHIIAFVLIEVVMKLAETTKSVFRYASGRTSHRTAPRHAGE